MWCANCQADVAAEASLDNRRIRCATCGRELNAIPSSALVDEKTREARQLLERWSQNTLAEPSPSLQGGGKLQGAPTTAVDRYTRPDGVAQAVSDAPASKFRVETSHPARQSTGQLVPDDGQAAGIDQVFSSTGMHMHQAHQHDAARPHFDVQAVIGQSAPQKSNSASLVGQLMAYVGVAVLTIGTALVMWGYFGGPPKYTPTGWLVATAGQMLLFLGVITLVSGGMEHTTEEVARRIDSIGERILRIEQASRQQVLQGPHVPAEQFADDAPLPHKRQVVEQQSGR